MGRSLAYYLIQISSFYSKQINAIPKCCCIKITRRHCAHLFDHPLTNPAWQHVQISLCCILSLNLAPRVRKINDWRIFCTVNAQIIGRFKEQNGTNVKYCRLDRPEQIKVRSVRIDKMRRPVNWSCLLENCILLDTLWNFPARWALENLRLSIRSNGEYYCRPKGKSCRSEKLVSLRTVTNFPSRLPPAFTIRLLIGKNLTNACQAAETSKPIQV